MALHYLNINVQINMSLSRSYVSMLVEFVYVDININV
jgi:hypothetical protein